MLVQGELLVIQGAPAGFALAHQQRCFIEHFDHAAYLDGFVFRIQRARIHGAAAQCLHEAAQAIQTA